MKACKGVKMTTPKWTIDTPEQHSRICAILLQDFMKRGVCQCGGGGDALRFFSLQVGGKKKTTTKTKWICHILFGVERFLS
jgi:hypothetical protein